MRIHALFAAAALLVLLPAHPSAQALTVQNGNLVYAAPGAQPRRLTTSGRDGDPALSPDGRRVVFVRRGQGSAASDGAGRTELWAVEVATGAERRLLGESPAPEPRENLAGFSSPRLAPDGRTVYFLAQAWATSGAVHALDPATGRTRYVCPGNSLEVVPAGEYAGSLVVSQHRYFVGGGSYDWYWLVTPDGRDVGPIGESLERFRESWGEAGDGSAAGRRTDAEEDG